MVNTLLKAHRGLQRQLLTVKIYHIPELVDGSQVCARPRYSSSRYTDLDPGLETSTRILRIVLAILDVQLNINERGRARNTQPTGWPECSRSAKLVRKRRSPCYQYNSEPLYVVPSSFGDNDNVRVRIGSGGERGS